MKDFLGIRIVQIGEDTLSPYIELMDTDTREAYICELGSKDAQSIIEKCPGHYMVDMLIRISTALELERKSRIPAEGA